MKFITAIHGIHTELTRPSWPWWFQAHSVKSKIAAVIQTEHYWAFAMPFWNNYVLNPKYGKALASRMKLLVDEVPGTPVGFLTHSNGGSVGVESIKELARLGVKTEVVVLIGAAVKADIEKSGLLKLYEDGMIDRIYAYVSKDDKVIKPLKWFPSKYGNLGVEGFKYKGDKFGVWLEPTEFTSEDRGFFVRDFPGMSHSGYFQGPQLVRTLQLAVRDLRLERMVA